MEQFISNLNNLAVILGFTDPISTLWNLLAYTGMIAIIVAVFSPKQRGNLFIFGPLALLFYAFIYLHDTLLASLQLIVTVSGFLNRYFQNNKLFSRFSTNSIIIFVLAVTAFITSFFTGQFSSIWHWFGAFGLLGIAFGLIYIPRKTGFAVMALGGLLVAIYAFGLQIWVFFVLNSVFCISNLIELLRKEPVFYYIFVEGKANEKTAKITIRRKTFPDQVGQTNTLYTIGPLNEREMFQRRSDIIGAYQKKGFHITVSVEK